MRLLFAIAVCTLLGCGDRDPPYPAPRDPDAAASVSIDRFSENSATLFDRLAPLFYPDVMRDLIPGPNEPIDMDGLFLVRSRGPAGELITYYALDAAPFEPARAFVIVDSAGKAMAGQLPVVEHIPGDTDYSDFVRIHEVHVGDDYPANALTSAAEIDAAHEQGVAAIVPVNRIANWALVPAGTTASLKFYGQPVQGFRAWHDGAVAHYLAFDRDLKPTVDQKVPASNVMVIFANDVDVGLGFEVEPNSAQTHNVVQTLPGVHDTYSSQWFHQKGKLKGFDQVDDWESAVANFDEALSIAANCPVVAP